MFVNNNLLFSHRRLISKQKRLEVIPKLAVPIFPFVRDIFKDKPSFVGLFTCLVIHLQQEESCSVLCAIPIKYSPLCVLPNLRAVVATQFPWLFTY